MAVALYPEGTRSPDGKLYRGKTGAARLAVRSGCPIIPVGLIGTWEVKPASKRFPRIRGVRVGVRYGRPLDFSRYEGKEDDRFVLRSITDEIMYELMLLTGQEYVDEYAAKVKDQIKKAAAVERPGRADGAFRKPSEASARPVARPLHRSLPSFVRAFAVRRVGLRRELGVELPGLGDLLRARPHAFRQPGEERRAEPGRLRVPPGAARRRRADRPGTGRADPSPPRRRRRAAPSSDTPASRAIVSTTSRVWYAIASTAARARCARVVPRVMPDDRAARVRIPVRRAEAR